MIACELVQADSPEAEECMMSTFDAILAMWTDCHGPVNVVEMLRSKADSLEAISNRRMH